MKIGVPKELLNGETRVSTSPYCARRLTALGHRVLIEQGAGALAGFSDQQFLDAGAVLAQNIQEIYANADMIVKVKEPQAAEYGLLREGQLLFGYLHIAANKKLGAALIESGASCIACETINAANHTLPLLIPMSEIAGRLSVQIGAHCLETHSGGRGILLGGVSGALPGRVVILGAGTVGRNAARVASGLGAQVIVFDHYLDALRRITEQSNLNVLTMHADVDSLQTQLEETDLVIGSVLLPGDRTPLMGGRDLISRMQPGSVIVDVSIDQGGCFETSRATSHEQPTYIDGGVVHYCVPNIPALAARTATFMLSYAMLDYVIRLAGGNWHRSLQEDPLLLAGLNIHQGKVTNHSVARALDLPYHDPAPLLS